VYLCADPRVVWTSLSHNGGMYVKQVRVVLEQGWVWIRMTKEDDTTRKVGPFLFSDASQAVNVAGVLANMENCEYLVDDDIIEQVLIMVRH